MKKIIISAMIIVSCTQVSHLEKPEPFIEAETMRKIIYDIQLLQSINNHYISTKQSDTSFKEINNIDIYKFVLKKYGIEDSIFMINNRYYVYMYKEYDEILESIVNEYESMKIPEVLDTTKIEK